MTRFLHDTLHERLRLATEDAHARVEQAFEVASITTDIGSYRRALRSLEAAVSAALDGLMGVAWTSWRPDLHRLVERRGWIESDLRDLDAEPLRPRPGAELTSAGRGLGCLYVLEGSALGGLVIFTAAQRNLGLTATFGARYFNGLGRGTLGEWRNFLTKLNAIPARSALGDEAESGAVRTFELFEEAVRAERSSDGATARRSA